MKALKNLFTRKHCPPLVYDYQDFQVKEKTVILENDLKITLPSSLIGKNIKEIKLIPKFKQVEVVFTYEQEETFLSQFKQPNNRILSIDLGLTELAKTTTNGVMWFLLMNQVATRRLYV